LRSSDCRKLRQRIVAAFGLAPEQGNVLVPDGTLSVKFSTYTNETGVSSCQSVTS
jgi:translation initiation factor 2D